jgi:transposase
MGPSELIDIFILDILTLYSIRILAMQTNSFRLVRQGLGAIPIIDSVFEKIGIYRFLSEALGNRRYTEAVIVLLKNVIIERNSLYSIKDWEKQYDPALLFGGNFGDDVLARALDRLFETDRASLLTGVVLSAIKAYRIDVGEIHQDTTSVSVHGQYENQSTRATQLKRGHSKDHRPDLKQLVYELSVTRDGTIPIHFKTHDGNKTDDTLHWENWQSLRGLLGRSDFLYVADSKLCVSKTLLAIDKNQGKFITIMPKTRSEIDEFSAKIEASMVRWEKVMAKQCSRKSKRINLYEVATGLHQTREGFKTYWYRSSEKNRRDWNSREEKISLALSQLHALAERTKEKPKKEAKLRKQAAKIIAHFNVKSWIKYEVALERVEKFTQLKRGRPAADTVYQKTIHFVPSLSCSRDENAIATSEMMDGVFPLVTNTELDARSVLNSYKHQPKLEKRHSLLKSGLHVAPIFLKKNDRIEALMIVYFLAQLVCSLVDRQLKIGMNMRNLRQIQILPEDRPSTNPTAEQVLRVFRPCTRHVLLQKNNPVPIQTFIDPLSKIQKQILELLAVPTQAYE